MCKPQTWTPTIVVVLKSNSKSKGSKAQRFELLPFFRQSWQGYKNMRGYVRHKHKCTLKCNTVICSVTLNKFQQWVVVNSFKWKRLSNAVLIVYFQSSTLALSLHAYPCGSILGNVILMLKKQLTETACSILLELVWSRHNTELIDSTIGFRV